MPSANVDVLVVTALKLEREAVRRHLAEVSVESASMLAADVGTSLLRSDQRIAIVECGPGNVGAALLSARAEEAFRPRFVVMFGIAGGIKDVQIGDVVASSKVYWLEGGKDGSEFRSRPDFAAVSGSLAQLARAAAVDAVWFQRVSSQGGEWPGAGRQPTALVAPVVVGEKVVADRLSHAARVISASYSDAVAVDMEDFGALRGAASAERAKVIAIRGISDLLSEKSEADGKGSQVLAAANAAAFLFDVLSRLPVDEGLQDSGPDSGSIVESSGSSGSSGSSESFGKVRQVGCDLYPEGPNQDALWERSGGDPGRLRMDGAGRARWWNAMRILQLGGGGGTISLESLLAEMRSDYPGNVVLKMSIGEE